MSSFFAKIGRSISYPNMVVPSRLQHKLYYIPEMLRFSTTSFLKDKFLGKEIEDSFEKGWRILLFGMQSSNLIDYSRTEMC
jgi:hypothetical protein